MNNNNWMQTFTGKKFYPTEPDPRRIDIVDIAHALSMLCRYGGHVKRFYSVAEHSVIVSNHVPEQYALWGLLHDATEAYCGDVIWPIKDILRTYRLIEKGIEHAIIERFELLPITMPLTVKSADELILHDEHKQVMGNIFNWEKDSGKGLGAGIQFWTPAQAKTNFLHRYYEICDV